MDKDTFVMLAEGYIRQHQYESRMFNAVTEVAQECDEDTDFFGLPCFFGPAQRAISDVIHKTIDPYDNFPYFVYDCDCSYELFNDMITFPDGSHPDVQNLDDLYIYIIENS